MNQSMQPYRTDSLSANFPLTEDYFEHFHKYRLEWQPPETLSGLGGYIKWYIDDQFVTAVYGKDIHTTSQSEIPTEPMYLVFNLAVSKDWGFPDAYYKDCPNKCWSCLDPNCTCAMPKGFCQALPTSMDIASVRVYQPTKVEPGYSRGCSPPNRPTKEFIAHRKGLYKMPNETNPLKKIVVGGGSCTTENDCGTVRRGICDATINDTCICATNWTGPHCLTSNGGYDVDEWKNPYYYAPPAVGSTGLKWTFVLVAVLFVVILVQWKTVAWDKSEKQMYRILAANMPTSSNINNNDNNNNDDHHDQEGSNREDNISSGAYNSYQHGYVPQSTSTTTTSMPPVEA